jgi:hypothetical protein
MRGVRKVADRGLESRPMQRRLTRSFPPTSPYSGLMEVDEAGTLERLKVNRSRIFDPIVAAQGAAW